MFYPFTAGDEDSDSTKNIHKIRVMFSYKKEKVLSYSSLESHVSCWSPRSHIQSTTTRSSIENKFLREKRSDSFKVLLCRTEICWFVIIVNVVIALVWLLHLGGHTVVTSWLHKKLPPSNDCSICVLLNKLYYLKGVFREVDTTRLSPRHYVYGIRYPCLSEHKFGSIWYISDVLKPVQRIEVNRYRLLLLSESPNNTSSVKLKVYHIFFLFLISRRGFTRDKRNRHTDRDQWV